MDFSERIIAPEEYPAEVKRCIEEMQQQSVHIQNDLVKIQKHKEELEHEVRDLTSRLHQLAHDQAAKRRFELELERTILETEKIYTALLERQKNQELLAQNSKWTKVGLSPVKCLQDAGFTKDHLSHLQEQEEHVQQMYTTVSTSSQKQKKEVIFKESCSEKERARKDNSECHS